MAKIPERALKAAKRAIVQPLTALKALDRILRRAGELTAFAYLELLRLVLSLLIVLVFPILCFVGSFFLGGLIAAGLTYLDASVDTGLTLFIFVGFPAYAFLFFVIYALPHVRPVVRHLLATTMATTHTATGDDDMTTKKEDHEGKLL